MGQHYTEPHWLDIVKEQEECLRYPSFEREDALKLGLLIKEAVEKHGLGHAAITVLEDNTVVFAWKMPGSSLENDWWMQRKLNVSLRTGQSSIRACLEGASGLCKPFWEERPDNYAACGGCFPIFIKGENVPHAYALVSGMHHQEDHQVIADAMSRQLGIETKSLLC